MSNLVVLSDKTGDLCNRLFRFARFYSSKPKEVCLVDLTLYQFAYLFSPLSVSWSVFLLLLRLLDNERFSGVVRWLKERPWVGVFAAPRNGDHLEMTSFYDQVGKLPERLVLVEHRTFGMRSGMHGAEARNALGKIFRLKSKYMREARRCLGDSLPGEVLVGVHLRRRDYRTFLGGRFFFSDADYNAIILRLDETWEGAVRPRFVLVCEEALDIGNFTSAKVDYFGPGNIGRDQALLALCDFILGPPSTFSGWVSFLHGIPRAEIWDADQHLSWCDFMETTCDYMSTGARERVAR